jgi:glycerol kinase
LRERLRIPWSNKELSGIAKSAKGQDKLIFVAALSGLGAPYWSPEILGTIYGVTAGTGLEHFVKAALEAVAFSVRDLVDALEQDAGYGLTSEIKVDGGMVANDYLMQFQADILGKSLIVPQNLEGTSQGVAFLAGLASGQYLDINSICDMWQTECVFEPHMSQAERDERYGRWREAINRTIDFYIDHN